MSARYLICVEPCVLVPWQAQGYPGLQIDVHDCNTGGNTRGESRKTRDKWIDQKRDDERETGKNEGKTDGSESRSSKSNGPCPGIGITHTDRPTFEQMDSKSKRVHENTPLLPLSSSAGANGSSVCHQRLVGESEHVCECVGWPMPAYDVTRLFDVLACMPWQESFVHSSPLNREDPREKGRGEFGCLSFEGAHYCRCQ